MPRKHHIDNHSVLQDSPRQDVVRESNLCYLQCFCIHLANSISLRVVYLHTNCMAQWHRQKSGSLLVSRRCYCASIPTLVLGTHCKTDFRSCGCRLEKGGLSRTQELSGGGVVRGAFPVGAVVVSLAIPRKASWISYN